VNSRPVLLTGGSGLLALNWAAARRTEQRVILGLHRRRVSLRGAESVVVNPASIDELRGVFTAIRPQMVVHTAGLTSIEVCESRPDLAQHVNVELAATVAEACASLHLPLVHISTDHLFAGDVPMVDESAEPAPLNVYARTKADAERRVLAVWPTALVIRTNFYGWGTSYRRSFSDTVLAALRSGEGMSLFTDVFYTPILADVVARVCHQLVDAGASGVFHVAGEDRLSKYDFGCRLADRFGLDTSRLRPGSITDLPALAPRPRDMSLNTDAVRAAVHHRLGGVDAHLELLRQQEEAGLARELQDL